MSDRIVCASCRTRLTDDVYECEECGKAVCKECTILFKKCDKQICKKCIDAVYPRQIVEEEMDKDYLNTDFFNKIL